MSAAGNLSLKQRGAGATSPRIGGFLPRLALPSALYLLLAGAGQSMEYRSGSAVPASWQLFTQSLKTRIETWVAAETPTARRFRDWGKANKGKPGGPPDSVIVKVWVNPDGSVQKVAFATFAAGPIESDFRALLTTGNIGAAPPPDMLQPVNLRVALPFSK